MNKPEFVLADTNPASGIVSAYRFDAEGVSVSYGVLFRREAFLTYARIQDIHVRRNLLEGALLVVAILFLFLGNLRAAIIVAAAIPLSMLFAFSAMWGVGIAGTLMSLGAIDFGLIVDSSVITVENAVRRLGEGERGHPVVQVVGDAASEVLRPAMFGQLIIMVVYLPILALQGVEGKMFRPMALTVIFALLTSLYINDAEHLH